MANVTVKGVGTVNTCLDDSCDGSHCKVCGGHFLAWYNGQNKVCDFCNGLPPEQQKAVKKATRNAFEAVHMSSF